MLLAELIIIVFVVLGLAFTPIMGILFFELKQIGEEQEEVEEFCEWCVDEIMNYQLERELGERLFREIWK